MNRLMSYSIAVLLGLILAVTVVYGQVLAKQYKTVALGPYSTGVYCLDGSAPQSTKAGVMLIIACPVK